MRKLFLILMTLIACTWSVQAQTRTYHGTVVDASNNEPLVGATVMPIGGGQGVACDIDGKFTLTVPANVKKARISYVGYNSQEVDLTNDMFVKLKSGASNLDEMIVVAYGTAKKSEYTGSASVVKAEQLENTLTSDATNALAGRVAGVQILSANGQPGASPTVRVRGIGSINGSNAPLFVVDGVPFNGDINQIPTTDIESMTVLKDAASTALYGSRGANGVILVTTKSGREGKVQVNVDARWGVNQRGIPDYDLVTDQRQYMEMVYSALNNSALYYENLDPYTAYLQSNAKLWSSIGYQTWTVPDGQMFIGTNGKFNPAATMGYVANGHMFIGDNWVKESFHDKLRQEYNVSVSGGTNKLNYYASFSYLGDNGIINASSFDRLNVSLNVDYQVYKWLKLNANMNYTYTNWNYPSDQTNAESNSSGNVFALATQFGPMYPFYVRNADGSLAIDEHTGKPIYSYGANEYGFTRNVFSNANPAGNFAYNYEENISDIFRGKWGLILTPIDGLTISGTMALHVDNTQFKGYDNPWYGQFASYGGIAQQSSSRYRTLDEQALAQYNKTFADVHDMSVMVGWESDGFQVLSLSGYGYNLYLPGNSTINNTLPDERKVYGAEYNLSHQALFARATYSYNGTYHLMGSFRRDGSSRFAPEHRWGNFFSVSAGWDIAKEKFMMEAVNVDMLKLKASFGQNGNDNLNLAAPYGYKPYEDFYEITGSNGVWSDGNLEFKGNRDITWEKTNAFNVGLDYSFFQGKLSGSIDYFSRQTSDMLMNVPVSPSLGYTSIPMNVGSMRNSGLEVEINYTPFNNENVTWDLNFNFTVPQNKILKLEKSLIDDATGAWLSGIRYMKEGESMYQYYLPKYAGVDPETGYAQYWAKDLETDEEYLTYKGSEALTTNSVPTGNMLPKIYGGFSTSVAVKGFDISASLSFQLGGRIMDTSYQSYMYTGTSNNLGNAFHKDMLNAWTPENPNSNVPILMSDDPYSSGSYTSDRWLTSSNYLSLNNVTVGYTIPESLTNRIKISQIRVYFAAENVALWSARKGMDPRQSYLTSNNSTYSPIRTLTGGLHITF